MRIQRLSGGLASQVFQYVFMRYCQINHPEQEWYLDDSDFFVSDKYNGYELENVFGVKPPLLSEAFDEDVWNAMIDKKAKGMSIPQIMLDNGVPIIMYAEDDSFKKENPFEGHVYRMMPEDGFYPQIADIEAADIYYHGTWIDKNWFNMNRELMLKELAFPELRSNQAKTYMDGIMQGTSVAMHIRRGDYVQLGLQKDTDYYYRAVRDLADMYDDFTVYVFSDDLFWCNQHAYELGLNFAPKVVYISGNMNKESYVDLQLMSNCKVIIMANSAFSFLAGLMDTRLEKYMNPWSESWAK